MKKIIFFLLMAMPIMASAQSTLTPQEQLEQAQKQLEEAQKALEAAKANAQRAQEEAKAREAAAKAKAEAEAKAKAKADAEATAKAAEIQKQIEEMKKETARLQEEAAKANAQQPAVEETTVEQPKQVEQQNGQQINQNQVEIYNDSHSSEATGTSKPVAKEEANEKELRTRLASIKDDDDNEDDKSVYLAKNAVPLVDGKVVWSAIIKAPGKSADEVYKITDEYLTALTSDKLQLEGSQVALKNPAKHNLTATVHEWLIFRNSALSLDRTEMYYVLNANCSNGQVEITMSRIRYKYDVQGKTENYYAESWITDKEAVNKKRTRLYPISGKFRKKTIDRKNEIFQTLAEALK